ncbi:hypothetical protein LXL04_006260 [Taraxacum kok-saghyz]
MRGRHLCEELMIEIFTRLPFKTLLQCRSVSKSWYSYIGSPDFIRMYTFRSQQKLVIRHRTYNENQEGEYEGFYTLHSREKLCPTRGYVGIPQLPFPFSYSIIVGSCNGIVCLYNYSDNSIKLWNPSIRRTVILPDCPRRCYFEVEVAFGYDPIADDYNVVRLTIVNVNRDGGSYVYAMKTDAWCLIDSPMPDFRKVKTKACFVSGALHWLAQRYKKSNWRDDSWSVEIKLDKSNGVRDLEGVWQLGSTGDLIFDLYSKGYKVYNPNTWACSSLVDFNDAYFLLVVLCVESLQLLDIGTSCY